MLQYLDRLPEVIYYSNILAPDVPGHLYTIGSIFPTITPSLFSFLGHPSCIAGMLLSHSWLRQMDHLVVDLRHRATTLFGHGSFNEIGDPCSWPGTICATQPQIVLQMYLKDSFVSFHVVKESTPRQLKRNNIVHVLLSDDFNRSTEQ